MLKRRIIPCLDVRDGVVVKGVRFRGHTVVGDIQDLAERYVREGADELVFYDIVASARRESLDVSWVRRLSKVMTVPFSVAGGIDSVSRASEVLNAGADKISINSPALKAPGLITDIAKEFGSQCVTVGIDSMAICDDDSSVLRYVVFRDTGDESTAHSTGRDALQWAQEACERGAGEIVLNCMQSDGTGQGYDLEQLRKVRGRISVPLVASGGAGTMRHFYEALHITDAVLAAGVFHRGEIQIDSLKMYLWENGLPVRRSCVLA